MEISDPGPCQGERRRCSRPATIVRQGRALCADCDARRSRARNDRLKRVRRARHEQGECRGLGACHYCFAAEQERLRGLSESALSALAQLVLRERVRRGTRES